MGNTNANANVNGNVSDEMFDKSLEFLGKECGGFHQKTCGDHMECYRGEWAVVLPETRIEGRCGLRREICEALSPERCDKVQKSIEGEAEVATLACDTYNGGDLEPEVAANLCKDADCIWTNEYTAEPRCVAAEFVIGGCSLRWLMWGPRHRVGYIRLQPDCVLSFHNGKRWSWFDGSHYKLV